MDDTSVISSGTATAMATAVVLWVKSQELVTTRRSMITAALVIGVCAALFAALLAGPIAETNWQTVAVQAITACGAAMGAMAPFPKPKTPTKPPEVPEPPTAKNASTDRSNLLH